MARKFYGSDNDYISRAAVNYGLNGVTECSYAFWLRISQNHATDGYVLWKDTSVATTETILARVDNVSAQDRAVLFEISSHSTPTIFPGWQITIDEPLNVWNRYLFTWKRNAIDSTDGVIYVNGISVPLTFVASGYVSTFTIGEESDVLWIGRREITGTPLFGNIAWVNIWNRQLTAAEAVDDYYNPLRVRSGLLSSVSFDERYTPLTDNAFGGDVSVTGTVPIVEDPLLPVRRDYSPFFTNLVR